MVMKTKICSKCKIRKPISEFEFRKDLNKYRNQCRLCVKKRRNKYYLNHREEIIEKVKDWYSENISERAEYQKNYREKNKKKLDKVKKDYYLENREKLLDKNKNYYQLHKEEKKKYDIEYNRINKDLKRRQAKIYVKNRRHNDLSFKLLSYLRTRIWRALKNKTKKSNKTIELVGCSIKDLKRHLESQFKPGMTWDNHGSGKNGKGMQEWHIDHIKPCASFDLSKPEEQRKCFHYLNLQPLWAKENLQKNRKKL